MAARQGRGLDGSEEDEFLENVEGFRFLQYQFEPECAHGEPVKAEEASKSGDSDAEREEGEHEVWLQTVDCMGPGPFGLEGLLPYPSLCCTAP